MAKQAQPAAVDPAANEPAPTIDDLLAERDLRIEELAASSVHLGAEKEAAVAALADAQKQIAEKDAALQELAAKLADARESLAKAEEEHTRSIERVRESAREFVEKQLAEREPGRTAKFVALLKIRASSGWVNPGEAFDATEADLEGYEIGVHFDVKD